MLAGQVWNLARVARWSEGIYLRDEGSLPPAGGGQEDLLALEESRCSFGSAALVKRHVCVKNPQLSLITSPECMERGGFSAICFAIAEGPYSGQGSDKVWYVVVYYSPSTPANVEEVFAAAGIAIDEYEEVPVDPASPIEEYFMALHGVGGCTCILSPQEYEIFEGPSLRACAPLSVCNESA
mmetsp:Transcript_91750/g.213388  ORF Transcript_91750/g.213388 Transcript_91750/m.213388 type:complete len:182 (-) Transcript_91750:17-562(-)